MVGPWVLVVCLLVAYFCVSPVATAASARLAYLRGGDVYVASPGQEPVRLTRGAVAIFVGQRQVSRPTAPLADVAPPWDCQGRLYWVRVTYDRAEVRAEGKPWVTVDVPTWYYGHWAVEQVLAWWPGPEHFQAGAVSMMDAYRLAKPVALNWDKRARLYRMNSVDTSGDYDPTQGADGRRTVWNVEYVIPGTERHLNVIVARGKPVAPQEFRNPTAWDGYADLPRIPMQKIMQTVRNQGLQPGTSLGFGYHFRLLYAEGRPILQVHGQTRTGQRTVLDFDPLTGELAPAPPLGLNAVRGAQVRLPDVDPS